MNVSSFSPTRRLIINNISDTMSTEIQNGKNEINQNNSLTLQNE